MTLRASLSIRESFIDVKMQTNSSLALLTCYDADSGGFGVAAPLPSSKDPKIAPNLLHLVMMI